MNHEARQCWELTPAPNTTPPWLPALRTAEAQTHPREEGWEKKGADCLDTAKNKVGTQAVAGRGMVRNPSLGLGKARMGGTERQHTQPSEIRGVATQDGAFSVAALKRRWNSFPVPFYYSLG